MFKGLGKLVKKAAPIAIGAFAPGIAPGMNPFLAGALTSGLGAVLTGQKPKDAILSGILGGMTSSAFAPAAAQPGADISRLANINQSAMEQAAGLATPSTVSPAATATGFGGFTGAAKGAGDAKTMSGQLLQSLNLAGEDKGNLLFRLLNTKMGEGLAAGLLAQALAGEEEEAVREYERRPFGAGYGGGQLGGINYADGGEAYFPRRNGGIDPSEGSGTKDDVPAMLMAGEFVMTRDAVKGMGDGNLRKGIGRMYKMMDNLERQA